MEGRRVVILDGMGGIGRMWKEGQKDIGVRVTLNSGKAGEYTLFLIQEGKNYEVCTVQGEGKGIVFSKKFPLSELYKIGLDISKCGFAVIKKGYGVVAKGGYEGEFTPNINKGGVFKNNAAASNMATPSLEAFLGRSLPLQFKFCGYDRLNMNNEAIFLAMGDESTKAAVKKANGFYMAQKNEDIVVIAVPSVIGKELPPFLSVLRYSAWLKSEKEGHGCYFLGINIKNSFVFPIIFQERGINNVI